MVWIWKRSNTPKALEVHPVVAVGRRRYGRPIRLCVQQPISPRANGITLIPGSYRALGNDGQHYNAAINSGNNFFRVKISKQPIG